MESCLRDAALPECADEVLTDLADDAVAVVGHDDKGTVAAARVAVLVLLSTAVVDLLLELPHDHLAAAFLRGLLGEVHLLADSLGGKRKAESLAPLFSFALHVPLGTTRHYDVVRPEDGVVNRRLVE